MKISLQHCWYATWAGNPGNPDDPDDILTTAATMLIILVTGSVYDQHDADELLKHMLDRIERSLKVENERMCECARACTHTRTRDRTCVFVYVP